MLEGQRKTMANQLQAMQRKVDLFKERVAGNGDEQDGGKGSRW